jgi:hypothetical protein
MQELIPHTGTDPQEAAQPDPDLTEPAVQDDDIEDPAAYWYQLHASYDV